MDSYNCIVCSQEFDEAELHIVALSKINLTSFKICEHCFKQSDPENDYKQARDIVKTYLHSSETRQLFTKNI